MRARILPKGVSYLGANLVAITSIQSLITPVDDEQPFSLDT